MQGRCLLERKENISKDSNIQINADFLNKGIYTLIINVNGKTTAIPFVK
jgi:hypothetical protein